MECYFKKIKNWRFVCYLIFCVAICIQLIQSTLISNAIFIHVVVLLSYETYEILPQHSLWTLFWLIMFFLFYLYIFFSNIRMKKCEKSSNVFFNVKAWEIFHEDPKLLLHANFRLNFRPQPLIQRIDLYSKLISLRVHGAPYKPCQNILSCWELSNAMQVFHVKKR